MHVLSRGSGEWRIKELKQKQQKNRKIEEWFVYDMHQELMNDNGLNAKIKFIATFRHCTPPASCIWCDRRLGRKNTRAVVSFASEQFVAIFLFFFCTLLQQNSKRSVAVRKLQISINSLHCCWIIHICSTFACVESFQKKKKNGPVYLHSRLKCLGLEASSCCLVFLDHTKMKHTSEPNSVGGGWHTHTHMCVCTTQFC